MDRGRSTYPPLFPHIEGLDSGIVLAFRAWPAGEHSLIKVPRVGEHGVGAHISIT